MVSSFRINWQPRHLNIKYHVICICTGKHPLSNYCKYLFELASTKSLSVHIWKCTGSFKKRPTQMKKVSCKFFHFIKETSWGEQCQAQLKLKIVLLDWNGQQFFNWGLLLPLRSTPFEVVSLRGCLPLMLSPFEVVSLRGCLPFRSSLF